jgi:protein transport protein SEC61 subunit gamma-like protein
MAITEKLKSFLSQCGRVWHLLRKPTMDEFKKVSIVAAVGLGLIGLIGFVIAIAMGFAFPK